MRACVRVEQLEAKTEMQSALLAQLETDKGELVEEVAREAAAREEERSALAASVDLERSAHASDLQVLQLKASYTSSLKRLRPHTPVAWSGARMPLTCRYYSLRPHTSVA